MYKTTNYTGFVTPPLYAGGHYTWSVRGGPIGKQVAWGNGTKEECREDMLQCIKTLLIHDKLDIEAEIIQLEQALYDK